MSFIFTKNLAQSILASGYTAGNSTITVQTGDGSKFSQPGNGKNIVLAIGTPPQFFLEATAISSDTFTVNTSGFDGSTPVSVTASTPVTEVISVGVLNAVLAAPGLTDPPLTGWTWDNQGSSTEDISGPGIFLSLTSQSNGGRYLYRTEPATPTTITAAFYVDWKAGSDNALNFGFRDNTGKLVFWHIANNHNIYVYKFTSSTSASAAYTSIGSDLGLYGQPVWLQIEDDGTNLIFRYRLGSRGPWQTFSTVSRTDFMTGGPSQVVIGGYTNGGAQALTLISWDQA